MASSKDSKKVQGNAKFYTLSAAAYSALEDIQAGVERFNQFLHWAVEGYRDFNFDMSNEIHHAIIPMKAWKQIDFPDDMVDWTLIGFKSGNSIAKMTQDRNIPKHFEIVNMVPQENTESEPMPEYLNDFEWFYNIETSQGRNWALPAGHNYAGYFDVDTKNRVFNFKRVVNNFSHVYLEYITDGINPCGRTVIHPYAFKAIKLYIHWMRKEHDDRYAGGDKERAKRLYEDELDKLLVRQLNLTIEDIKEAIRAGAKPTPKG